MCEKFSEGQKVLHDGKLTHIENIYGDGTCRIANPDWDWDNESECVMMGEEDDIPYWITVNVSELLPFNN